MSEQATAEELERQAEKAQAAAGRARKAADDRRRRELLDRDERLERYDRTFVEGTSERARSNAQEQRQAEDRLRQAILETEFGRAYVELRRLQRRSYDVGIETVTRRTELGMDPGGIPPIPPEPFLLPRMEAILESEAARLADEDLEAMQLERQAAGEQD
jgi:hypothetical protein